MALSSLHHVIDLDWMKEAYRLTRKDGVPGIDGVTAADYEANLEANLSDLLDRIRSGRYHAPPVRRAYIPKADGTQRPLGIPTFEDKVAQRAVAMVLEAIYEQDFLPCSYGFRPGRSAHQALDALRAACMGCGVRWCIDVDIKSYFDTIDRSHLRDFLDQRVTDGVIRRMIDKWLKAGVLEEGRLHRPTQGSPQGGVISPCLSNIYLHHVLDVWFEHTVRPRLKGRASLVRYADDVRHITRRWIPFAERRGLEDVTPGPTAYLAAKVKGDRSMPSKRERSEDADDPVPQGPRDTVRTELFEPQPPTMQAYIPRHSVLRRGHRDRATRMSSLEPSTRWAMGHRPIQGGERGTSVALDTSSTAGMWDRPTRREAQGDGAAVVLRGRESRPHGEGRQVS